MKQFRSIKRLTFVYSLFLLFLAAAVPLMAQTPVTDDQVNEIAKQVYCPVCESTPLDVCQTQACADWRELIRTKLSQGQSKEEIFQYFADQYGDRVLASPPKRGFNWLLWAWPAIAAGIGIVIFSRYLRKLRSSAELAPANPAPAAPVSSDDYIARVERELERRK
ncbi:MAG: cytochrome c-type biogenesis protein CcmH [Anaerolineae bacterium]